MDSSFANISSEIYRLRTVGVVHVYFAHREDDRLSAASAANAFISRRGFTPLHDGWQPISRRDVLRIWTRILHRDLAYNSEIMPQSDAESLALRFLALFDPETAVYLTNCVATKLDRSDFTAWSSITAATFDIGAVIMDSKNIGLIWAEDED